MNIEIFYSFQDFDSNGNPVGKSNRIKANSLVGNFINLLGYQLSIVGVPNVKDTLGVSRLFSTNLTFPVNAAVGIDTYGLVVGTGTTAVSIADYKLQTQILHGSTSGKLSHGAVTFTPPFNSGSSQIIEVVRTFNNNSGGDITITEIGLVCAPSQNYLFERTLATKVVVNGGATTIRSQIIVTV